MLTKLQYMRTMAKTLAHTYMEQGGTMLPGQAEPKTALEAHKTLDHYREEFRRCLKEDNGADDQSSLPMSVLKFGPFETRLTTLEGTPEKGRIETISQNTSACDGELYRLVQLDENGVNAIEVGYNSSGRMTAAAEYVFVDHPDWSGVTSWIIASGEPRPKS